MTLEAIYDEAYYQRMRSGGELYTRFLSVVPIAEYRDKPILDVGCGRGDLIRRLLDAGCCNLTGFDFSSAAIDSARSALAGSVPGPSVNLLQGSVSDAHLFPEASFELAYMTDVVEHLPPDVLDAGLSNVRRWLTPSGQLVVHTFPTLGPHRLYQQVLRLQGRTGELATLDSIHCNVQTRRSLGLALERAGFGVSSMWLQNDFTLTSSAYKALRPGMFKTVLGTFFDDVLGSAAVRAAFGEYAAMSIYAVARA